MDTNEDTAGAAAAGEPAATAPTERPSPQPDQGRGVQRSTARGPLSPAQFNASDSNTLVVGQSTKLSGDIGSCDKVVVRGSVKAELSDCREIEVAQTGTFNGTAEVDEAVVNGLFEGTLTVHKTLSVRPGGRVRGTVRYGQLEVQLGGRIVGDFATLGDADG